MSKEIVEMVDKNRENFYKAESLLWTIQSQADFFEMRTGMRPTIFLSMDLFRLVQASYQDVVVATLDKTERLIHTVCGYDLEIIAHGENLLYVGYKVSQIG